MKLNHVDIFSGIGGFALGLEATGGFSTKAFCEIDPFCHKVLAKNWPNVPIHTDVREFEYDGTIDIITGGYPCQPFSAAGKRKGESDPRHLWPAMFGIIKKHRPRWVIGENVAGHVSMGLDQVLADLECEGYEAIPFIIPACAVGAPHRRDRIWIIASDTQSQHGNVRKSCQCEKEKPRQGESGRTRCSLPDTAQLLCDGCNNNTAERAQSESLSELGNCDWQTILSDSAGFGQPRPWEFEQRGGEKAHEGGQAIDVVTSGIGCFWEAEPAVGRVVNGLSKGLDSGGIRGGGITKSV